MMMTTMYVCMYVTSKHVAVTQQINVIDKHCAVGWFYKNARNGILQNKNMPVMNRERSGGMVARPRSARSRT